MRICSICRLDKPLSEFPGRDTYCRPCRKAYNKAHYLANREKRQTQIAAYAATHREQRQQQARASYGRHRDVVLERSRTYYQEHKEERKQQIKAWFAAHHDEWVAYYRQWRWKNPDKTAQYGKDWYARDPEKARRIGREKEARRQARKKATRVGSIDYYAILLRDGLICYLCGIDLSTRKIHFDHVIPLSRGGLDVDENISPSCSPAICIREA